MSTDLATVINRQSEPLAVVGSTSDAMARLGEWVTAASQAHALVAPLVNSAFVPDAYKPKVDPRASDEDKAAAREVAVANATAAVLLGLTLGLDPLTALQQIYLVKGRPGSYAKAKVALLQARGYEIWTEKLTDTEATVCGCRPGSEHAERITITMDMAKRAGWTAANEAYAKTPQDMLWARAAGRVCDRIGADVLMGLATVEDLRDTVHVEAHVGEALPDKVTAEEILGADMPAEAAPPAAPDVPAATELAATEPATTTTPPDKAQPITVQMQNKLIEALRTKGITDKADSLARLTELAGRPVKSTKDLSRADYAAVMDALDPPTAADAEQEPQP